jgi:hypothetical protein
MAFETFQVDPESEETLSLFSILCFLGFLKRNGRLRYKIELVAKFGNFQNTGIFSEWLRT